MADGGVQIGITGANGALGSRLIRQLVDNGYPRMVAISRSAPAVAAAGVEHRTADVRDLAALRTALHGCTDVFHLAAVADAKLAGQDPAHCFEINTQGTANVMEACRLSGVRTVTYASTGYVYGRPLDLPIRETHSTNPLSVYAASKLAGETIVRAYATAYRLTVMVARLSNVYGGPLNSSTVIGRSLEAAAAGRPIQLRSLDETRDFLYIDDAAEGMRRLWESLRAASGSYTVNLSTAQGSQISDVVEELLEAASELGLPAVTVVPPDGEPDLQTPTLVLDNAELRELTGWTPGISLRDGLKRALETLA